MVPVLEPEPRLPPVLEPPTVPPEVLPAVPPMEPPVVDPVDEEPLPSEPVPEVPRRLLEENLWRAIRHGLSGELIDLARGEVVPARARIEQLIEWVAPVADELGTTPYLTVPAANAAERQLARHAEGATLREIYAEQVAAGEPVRD